MTRLRVRHSVRVLGVVTTAGLLSVVISGCSGTDADSSQMAELRAELGSDMLSVPDDRVYEVTSVSFVGLDPIPLATEDESPESSGPGSFSSGPAVPEDEQPPREFETEGSLTLNGDIITAAALSIVSPDAPLIEFVLTDPVILPREGGAGESVTATGMLRIGSTERHGVQVELTPAFDDPESASTEFDMEIGVPSTMVAYTSEQTGLSTAEVETITATLELIPAS